MTFAHLHVHSDSSLLDSIAKVDDLCAAAAADGQPAVAITDHGSLSALYRLRSAAAKHGIKPICGLEAYLAFGSRFEHNTGLGPAEENDADGDASADGAKTKKYMHLTLLARDRQGWLNLVTIFNKSYDSQWVKPRIDYDLIAEHGEGLIVLTGCIGGPVAGPLSRGDQASADEATERLIAAVGRENVYVEVMEHGNVIEAENLPRMYEHADRHGLKVVVTNDCHHVHVDDQPKHAAWLCVQTGSTVANPKFAFHGAGYYLRTGDEMRALRADDPRWQEACAETTRLAGQVADDVIGDLPSELPAVRMPEGYNDSKAYLFDLIAAGARQRYPDRIDANGRFEPELAKRLRFEFDTIVASGYPDYFLIVHDLIAWANSDRGLPTPEFPDGEPGQKKPILTGPGRGSAAGSVASHCLGIVGVDPLRYDLLFERFLEPGRVGMPDIDLDFERDRRQEVLAYLSARYGADCVAQIGTLGLCRSKAAIKDAARVLGLPVSLAERLAKLVPLNASDNAKPFKLHVLMDPKSPEGAGLREAVAESEDARQIIDVALGFEDAIRTQGIHACGVLITAKPLAEMGVPLRWAWDKNAEAKTGLPITAWDGSDVGEDGAGMLKLDVLGLRTLDLLSAAVDNIEAATGERIDLFDAPDPESNDPRVRKAWTLLSEGKTSSVFQLESSGISDLTQDVAPRNLDDLSAILALYRPGPMGAESHTKFARARKNGIDYSTWTKDEREAALLHEVLEPTYGLIVYQEQVMRLGTVVGGMDVQQRSQLRKAVAKKKVDVLAASSEVFFAGCDTEILEEDGSVRSYRFERSTAEKLWADFKDMGSYAFNKSHSLAYAQIAYLTALLKANWPAEYAAAVLSITERGEKRDDVMSRIVGEGITIVPPDINVAQTDTIAVRDAQAPTVMLGLSEIKGVGKVAADLVAEREANGPFAELHDFLSRVAIKSDVFTGLVDAQALRSLGRQDRFGHTWHGVKALATTS